VQFCTSSFFFSDFAPNLLPTVFCSKSSIKKRGKGAKDGVQNRTISKKIGGKSAIEHKDGVQNQKGGKKMGCKIAKKKEGVQNHTIDKR